MKLLGYLCILQLLLESRILYNCVYRSVPSKHPCTSQEVNVYTLSNIVSSPAPALSCMHVERRGLAKCVHVYRAHVAKECI